MNNFSSHGFSRKVENGRDIEEKVPPLPWTKRELKMVKEWTDFQDETSNEGLVVDVDGPVSASSSEASQNSRITSEFGEPPKVARLGHHFTFGVGGGVRMRPSIRGTSKRGRPRGSRRGGPIGGKGRGILFNPNAKNSASPGPQSPNSTPSPGSSSSPGDQTAQQGEQKIHIISKFTEKWIFPGKKNPSLPRQNRLNSSKQEFCKFHYKKKKYNQVTFFFLRNQTNYFSSDLFVFFFCFIFIFILFFIGRSCLGKEKKKDKGNNENNWIVRQRISLFEPFFRTRKFNVTYP